MNIKISWGVEQGGDKDENSGGGHRISENHDLNMTIIFKHQYNNNITLYKNWTSVANPDAAIQITICIWIISNFPLSIINSLIWMVWLNCRTLLIFHEHIINY